jgi:iron complex transport system ATP-binding protein
VSFALASGEFVALVGPNGAGKSTVLKALAGVLPMDAGAIEIEGAPAGRLNALERARRLAWLPQSRPVAWNLRVEDVVALGRFAQSPDAYDRLGQEARAAVDAALAKADAAHLAGRAFQTLSGGEQARVHLARLLSSTAPRLLLDEPCAALDIVHQLSLMETLADEAASGRSVVVVLHDLELAARYCPRVIVMEAGRVVADGPPADILSGGLLSRIFGVKRGPDGRLQRDL